MANAPSKSTRLDPKNYYIGAKGSQVEWLDEMLGARGYAIHKKVPSTTFTNDDKLDVQAFQKAEGYKGSDADGFPGTATLKELNKGRPAMKKGWKGTLHAVRAVAAYNEWEERVPEADLKIGSTVSGQVVTGLFGNQYRYFVVYDKPYARYYRLDTYFSHTAGGNPITEATNPSGTKAAKPANDPIAKIVSVAKSQVGYHEGRDSDGTWNNIQKYAQEVPGLGWNNGGPWCATFVSWCAMKANLADYYPRTATVSTAMGWFKAKNQWSEYPAVGAQVIYGVNGDAHTGLVYDYDSTYIYTVEGNTNTNGSAEGDGVYAKKRLRRDTYVHGYGYPKIPGYKLKSADPNYKG